MKRFDLFFTFIRLPFDYLALVLAAATAYSIRLSVFFASIRKVQIGLSYPAYVHATFIIAGLWIVLFALNGLYTLDTSRKFGTEFNRIIQSCTIGLAAIAVVIFLRGELFNSRFIVLAAWGISIVYITILRLALRLLQVWLYSAGIGRREVVLVGHDETSEQLLQEFTHHPRYGVHVALQLPQWDEHAGAQIAALLKKQRLQELILTSHPNQSTTLSALSFAGQHHLTFTYTADLFATYAVNRHMHMIGSVPLLMHKPTRLDGWGRIIKRLFDIGVAVATLTILSPLILLVALVILMETGRPIFFKNNRVGEHGEQFNVLKFRTMYQKFSIGEQFEHSKSALALEKKLIATQSKNGPVYKIKNDPRVTPFGRFLRAWSLDELPNFFNVLFGSMSVVGPRPHQPREVAHYQAQHRKVFAIKPGVTGLAQISGRSELPFEKEVQLDTYYIEHWSLTMDLFIILKTPFVILSRKGSIV